MPKTFKTRLNALKNRESLLSGPLGGRTLKYPVIFFKRS